MHPEHIPVYATALSDDISPWFVKITFRFIAALFAYLEIYCGSHLRSNVPSQWKLAGPNNVSPVRGQPSDPSRLCSIFVLPLFLTALDNMDI